MNNKLLERGVEHKGEIGPVEREATMQQLLERDSKTQCPQAWNAQEQIIFRSHWLPDDEGTMLRAVLDQRMSHRQAAAMIGIPPGTVTRRVRRLLRRLCDPLIVALIERPGALRHEYRQLGIEHFLHRQSAHKIAQTHAMSIHEVRRILAFVRGWRSDTRN